MSQNITINGYNIDVRNFLLYISDFQGNGIGITLSKNPHISSVFLNTKHSQMFLLPKPFSCNLHQNIHITSRDPDVRCPICGEVLSIIPKKQLIGA